MWFVCSVFVVLWVIGIEFYFPVALLIALFAAAVASAGVALFPVAQQASRR
ncbi:MAG TPA: hypothetical protein VEG32_02485 [Clostridia bacterium]|nr:hypothetical protein [Clostridia bacterium]